MKVLLIYPASPRSHWPRGLFRSQWVPTGMAYIAAALKRAGHAVRVHVREEQLIKNGFDWVGADALLRSIISEFQPEMLGLSIVTSTMPEAATIAKLAKEICTRGVVVVAGGPHPTALPEITLKECSAIDAVVLGEGERTMVELSEAGGADKAVAGIVFRSADGFVHTDNRPPEEDLDRLAPPAYDLFDMKHYATPNRWMIRWLPLSATNIRTSRGCPNRCRFCAGHVASGLGVRYHSIDYVLQQIRRVVQRFGVKAIHFEDDTLGADSARLLDLCEAIRRSDLRRRICWDGCLRVDQAEPELLAQMKSAGCIQVEYGFESGSDSALRRLGKNATGELNRRAVRLTREAGLRIFADIMFGLPGETEEDFKATINFLRWAKPEVISTSRLAPLPGTPIYDDLPPDVRESLDWAGYSYLDWPGFRLNLTAMDDQRFEEFYQQTQKYFLRPAMAAALLRDTPLDDAGERRRLRRRLAKFAVQHPIRAARLPVRGLFRELLR